MKNRKILEKLSNLKKEDCIHEVFSFRTYNSGCDISLRSNIPNCGTCGCLLGELPGITEDWCFDETRFPYCIKAQWTTEIIEQAAEYFDIDRKYIKALFIPSEHLEITREPTPPQLIEGAQFLEAEATIEEVQYNLKIFLAQNPE